MNSGRIAKLICLAVLALSVLMAAPASFAQRANSNDNGDQRRVSPGTAQAIEDALKLVDAKKYSEAANELEKLNLGKLKPFGVSRVELILASIDNLQEKYTSARGHLQKALASGGLNETETSHVRMNIAQLFMVEKNWAAAATTLEEWLRHAKNPDYRPYFLLAVAYYWNDEHDKALAPAERAVQLMQEPKEGVMRLLLSLYLDRKDYQKAIVLSKRMIGIWPKKKSYWLMLASLYQAAKDGDKALAAIQIAYNAGYFSEETDYLRLADMLLINKIPQRCGRMLEANIASGTVKPTAASYEKLGNCWIAAREFERSLKPFERGAELSDNGELYLRLAEAQMQNQDWKSAETAARNALDKGELDDSAHAQLIVGIALFKQHGLAKAGTWFRRAAKDKKYRENANAYLNAIRSCATQSTEEWCR